MKSRALLSGGQRHFCAPWWLTVVIAQTEKRCSAKKKKNVLFSISYYIDVG